MSCRVGGVVSVAVVVLVLSGCSGRLILSEAEFTRARQVQIDRVTTWADRMGTPPVLGVSERVGACTDPDQNPGSGHSTYSANVTRKADARDYLDDVVRPEMKREGWAFRDRSNDGAQLQDATLDYYWSKPGSTMWVVFSDPPASDGGRRSLQVGGNSPCGWLGDLRKGNVYPDYPGYLPPTVPGPTIEDSLKRPTQDSY